MKLSSRIQQYSLAAMLALPLSFGMPAANAADELPAAISTLDVCEDSVSGKWIYSGVVAVPGSLLRDSSVVGIDYSVQNMTSAAGYTDALRAVRLPDQPTGAAISARVARFSIEAAPLTLGSLRNVSQVTIYDPLSPTSPAIKQASHFELTTAVCGCPRPTGCTRTQGYWKSKPGIVWPAPYQRSAMFFSSGLTWQQMLETPPQGGNGYIILAHQYIAAVLNHPSRASAPYGVHSVINKARTYLQSGVTPASCGGSLCQTQKTWAGILDTYNNGHYPGAPAHCPG